MVFMYTSTYARVYALVHLDNQHIHHGPACLWGHQDGTDRKRVTWHPGTFMIMARREARQCAIQMGKNQNG